MADDRNAWLDHEAAERLLRGEPVDATDDYARLQAERLAEALDAARTAHETAGPAGELPGEAAALVAFREARAARASGAVGTAGTARATVGSDLGAVRIGSLRPVRWARPALWARPARWGLAVSLAGLAVGGVAVASGTGVLPAFGPEPAPSTSVSAPDQLSDPDAPTVAPPGSALPTAPPHPGHPSPSLPGAQVPAPGTDGRGSQEPDRPGDNDGDEGQDRKLTQAPDGTWPTATVKACRDFRDGKLDPVRQQQLAAVAKDGGVKKFCDQVLAGRQEGGSTGSTGTTGGDGGTGTGSGGSGTGGTGKGDDSGDPDGATGGGKQKPGGKGKPDGKGKPGGKNSGGRGDSAPAVSWTPQGTPAPVAAPADLAV
ncbi:hypothetical protein ACFPM3_29220 [Streptomyces coeruleoprunus]|uniref:Extensin n=1 Tax=Streptomyces coeruleoprunus TaxID=285563 RepID=A0ABV9XLE4_9ACTN